MRPTQEIRESLIGELGAAVDALARGFADVGAAYEVLDEAAADRLEAEVYGPAQGAYAALRRTRSEFAARHGLAAPAAAAQPGDPGRRSARELLEQACEAFAEADAILVEIQDSGLGVEVGDQEQRAGTAEVRRRLDPLPGRIEALLSVLGR